MKILEHIICLAIFSALISTKVAAQFGHEKNTLRDSIEIDGAWRNYEYHVPPHPVRSSRLVIVLHGDGMTTKSIQTTTGFEFNKLVDNTGATIVVYPQGYKNYWNDHRKNASFETNSKRIDDVAFIKAIIQRMERRYHTDRNNVFAIGYFKGGNICYKLANAIPDMFKGFAVIGEGLSLKADHDSISVEKPISIMIINDDNDDVGAPNENGKAFSSEKTIDYWLSLLKRNDKSPLSYIESTVEKANSTIARYDYHSREKNKRISLLKIVKRGYSFPNPHVDQWPHIAANMNKHINIPETVMQFFYQVQYSNAQLR